MKKPLIARGLLSFLIPVMEANRALHEVGGIFTPFVYVGCVAATETEGCAALMADFFGVFVVTAKAVRFKASCVVMLFHFHSPWSNISMSFDAQNLLTLCRMAIFSVSPISSSFSTSLEWSN